MAGSTNSIVVRNVLRGRLSEDNLMAGAVGTAYNPTYAIVTEAGAQIVLYINSSNYQFYAELKDKYGNHISNSNIIDLPLESMVVGGSYDAETKEVVLVLDNGNEIRFSVADLVEGLVSTEQLNTILNGYVQFTDYATAVKAGAIKISDTYATAAASGVLTSQTKTYEQYDSLNNDAFVSKGTLENVIMGKELTNKEYVDVADEIFENDLFGDETVGGNGEGITLNNTADAPMNIDLKGNTYQYSTTGKNLFNPTYTFSNRGVTSTIDNQQIKFNGTSTGPGTYKTATLNIPSGTYIISLEIISGTHTNNKRIWFDFYNGNTKIDSGSLTTTGNFTKTFSTNITQINVGFDSDDTFTDLVFRVQIESGSSATSYEPYTNGASPNPDYPQDIQVVSGDNTIKVEGKNLLDITATSQTKNNVVFTVNSDGTVLANGKANGTSNLSLGTLNLKANTTYFISGSPSGSGSGKYRLELKNSGGSTQVSDNGSGVSYTPTESGTYSLALVYWYNYTLTDILFKPMIEIGNSASTFEKYVSQTYPITLPIGTELCKIGDYQDTIVKDNGKWYLHKEIGKVVLNGSENWLDRQEGLTNYLSLKLAFSGVITYSGVCNNFVYNSSYNLSQEYFLINGYWQEIVISILKSRLNTVDTTGFKTWLSTHNTIIYYVLATPTNTEITDTTLLSQLNALEGANSYDNQTNVSQVNNDLPFIIAATAFVDSTAGRLAATVAQINTLNEVDNNLSANKEDKSNKVATISASSTDTEYPTAKCVYDIIGDVESLLEALDIGSGV